ncbi:MAG: class I SAM-dependent methyltransferase [Porticoccaceae bacterium]|nr:class I SAM-dependent methyltransferase [Porticoccaceae bacterium]
MALPAVPQSQLELRAIDWTGLPARFMNPGELEVLCALVRSVSPQVVVEFGINSGRTAKAILREVDGITRYIGIDVPPGYVTEKKVQRGEVPAIAGELVRDDPRVELLVRARGSHDLTADDLPPCDAVFIDGDHSRAGVEQDTALAMARVRPGGIIIWHDYHALGTVDVREVLDDYHAAGAPISLVAGTWLAFRRL